MARTPRFYLRPAPQFVTLSPARPPASSAAHLAHSARRGSPHHESPHAAALFRQLSSPALSSGRCLTAGAKVADPFGEASWLEEPRTPRLLRRARSEETPVLERSAPAGRQSRSGVLQLLLLLACGVITAEYGLVQTFGAYRDALAVLAKGSVSGLYEAMNWGSCALAFLAGLAFDAYGPAATCLLGGGLAAGGLLAAAGCWAAGVTAAWPVSLGYLTFGFGTSCLNTAGVLAAVRAVPPQHAGKASAGVLCCLALGMSVHAAIYARCFNGDAAGFIGYQVLYSVFVGVLGFALFRSAFGRSALESGGAEQEADVEQAVPAKGSGFGRRLYSALSSPELPWLAALFLVPLAYSFALLGVWSVCAERLALAPGEQARTALGLGLFSALGRLGFGGLADLAPEKARRFGWEVCCAGGLLAFQAGFFLLEANQRRYFQLALWLQSLGYGGVLALAPAALRCCFPERDLGLVYGLLYQFLAVSFTIFNRTAVPQAAAVGAACFRGWFRAASALNLAVLLWGLARCGGRWRELRGGAAPRRP